MVEPRDKNGEVIQIGDHITVPHNVTVEGGRGFISIINLAKCEIVLRVNAGR